MVVQEQEVLLDRLVGLQLDLAGQQRALRRATQQVVVSICHHSDKFQVLVGLDIHPWLRGLCARFDLILLVSTSTGSLDQVHITIENAACYEFDNHVERRLF